MNIILQNCNIFTAQDDHTIHMHQDIYIKDERIEKIQPTGEAKPGYQLVDLKGAYVMPGFINLHVHMFGSGKPSKVLGGGALQKAVIRFASTTPGQKVLHGIMKENMKQALYSGVTTLRGVGDFFYSDVLLREELKNHPELGPRLLVSGPAITVHGGHGDGTFAICDDSIPGLCNLVKRNHAHQVDLIKICVTGGVMDAKKKGEPGELKMNLAQTRAVSEQAHALGYQVASHTESREGVKVALQGGVDTIEHGSELDDTTISLFQKTGSSFICTLSPALPLARFSSDRTKLNELCVYNSKVVFDNMVTGVKQALANGIPVGLGTDASCPYVTQYNMWRELCYFAKYAQVSNGFALYTATNQNASILGLHHEIGTIESGKYADMIVVKQDPTKDLTVLKDIKMVLHQGHLIMDPHIKKKETMEKELDELL